MANFLQLNNDNYLRRKNKWLAFTHGTSCLLQRDI